MVNFMIPALGVAALTSFSMAAPGARISMELAQRDSSFSFTQWVEDKINDPEGANLTAEEAWEKAQNAERGNGFRTRLHGSQFPGVTNAEWSHRRGQYFEQA